MKRLVPILLVVFLVLPIGLYFYSRFGPRFPPPKAPGANRGTVEFVSDVPGYTITKTRYFNDV